MRQLMSEEFSLKISFKRLLNERDENAANGGSDVYQHC